MITKQNVKNWAIGIAFFLLICCIIALIVNNKSALSNTPSNIPVNTVVVVIPTQNIPTQTSTSVPISTPTSIPTPTVDDIALYRSKVADWGARFQVNNNVVISALSGDTLADNALTNAGKDMARIQAELYATNPPAVFKTYHMHFTAAIDNYISGIQALGKGDVARANTLLEKSLSEFNAAKASLKTVV